MVSNRLLLLYRFGSKMECCLRLKQVLWYFFDVFFNAKVIVDEQMKTVKRGLCSVDLRSIYRQRF